jgi:hypothetical protein
MISTTRRSFLTQTGQVRYSYLVTLVGVAIMTITTAYGLVRAILTRDVFASRGGFGGGRQLGIASFGLTNNLTIFAVIIALVGLAWLGLALRKSHKGATD